MTLRTKALAVSVVLVLVAAGVSAPAALQASDPQESGPTHSLEGAWYGMTNFDGLPATPTFDTFTSNAQRHGVQGTFLCTIPAEFAWGQTPSGHGNWVRIGTSKYAFTAMRAMINGGAFVGWARFWGTVTAVSDDELTGTINTQMYLPNGTPISQVYTGTLERHRVPIVLEQ